MGMLTGLFNINNGAYFPQWNGHLVKAYLSIRVFPFWPLGSPLAWRANPTQAANWLLEAITGAYWCYDVLQSLIAWPFALIFSPIIVPTLITLFAGGESWF